MKKTIRMMSGLLMLLIFISLLPIHAAAAGNAIEAKIQGNNVIVKGTIYKNISGDGFAVNDKDCNYLSMAIFDLSLMSPISNVTVMALNSEQKSADHVEFQIQLELINGRAIDNNDPDRYVLMGSFEKAAGLLSQQETGSQFSCKLTFNDDMGTGDNNSSTIVQINRQGYITKDDAELKDGPNDELPAVGRDGLYLKLKKGTEVLVLYKGDYTYRVEYDGNQYYTVHENITFETTSSEDNLADGIRKLLYTQSLLADFYMYGVSEFDFSITEGSGDMADAIQLTRAQLMNGSESVSEALKALLKEAKRDGVSDDQLVDPYVDAVIEEDPMDIIGKAANDLYSDGYTEAIRERNEALQDEEDGDSQESIQQFEEDHADDIIEIEIDKEVVGELLGRVWDTHLADEIINATADSYGLAIAEKIYQGILGWSNRIPRNYTMLMECYTGTPTELSGFLVYQNGYVIVNDYSWVQGNISQSEIIRIYGDRMSEQMQGYIKNGELEKLPFTYQTRNVSSYNRFLPGSFVIFEVWDFAILASSQKQYLGVYAGNGEFYLPDFEDSAFDTLCKLDGIERIDGLIKITQKGNTSPLSKNASYGFLDLCFRNISIKNVYEADISLFNDPKYDALNSTYFPDMTAMRMSQIRFSEIAWQLDNNWRAPMVWDD